MEEIRHNLDLLICQNFYDLQTTHPEFAKPLQHSKLIRGEEKTAQENNRR
ncbi:MAG: hypothetical protein JO327_06110 [Nitrososphaeraceae archaeon]|nr:hypothetical protein [Nitrososphaeraceae archaeon]